MNCTPFFAFAVPWLAFVLPAVARGNAAESASTAAAISGRVQNVVTGQYLSNARVVVRGTDLEAFTDETGTYRLPPVKPGPMILEVTYTGLDAERVAVTTLPGQMLEQNFQLTSRDRYGDGTVKMDSFLVAATKLTEGEALATNEQRHAANIMNVVSADAFGDVSGGNVA
jgi:hypothetical protein